jgi:hypothetical protein
VKNLFLCVLFFSIAFGCMDIKPSVPTTTILPKPSAPAYMTSTGQVMSVAQLVAKIAENNQIISDKKDENSKLNVQLKVAKTAKIQQELWIAGAILAALFVGCVLLFFFVPPTIDPLGIVKKGAVKAGIICIIGIAGCGLAIRLAPYRTWIEVGIALITAGVATFYLTRKHHEAAHSIFSAFKKEV